VDVDKLAKAQAVNRVVMGGGLVLGGTLAAGSAAVAAEYARRVS
jgi:hypothetical protein